MPTTVGSEVTNIFNKRVLGAVDFDTRLLTSLRAIDQETLESMFKTDGVLLFGVMSGTGNPDEVTFGLPLRFVTAIDDMAVGEFSVTAGNDALATLTFENTNTQLYEFGCKHVRFPTRMTVNPRTAEAEYESHEIGFGEQGDPDSVVDLGGGSIELVIDSLLDGPGIDLSGVSCLVYLKDPQSDQDSIALVTATSTYGAPNNKVTVPSGGLGQSTVSTTASDYEVTILGIRGIQSPGRFTAPSAGEDKYIFLGNVTGNGAGNPITGPDIDQSGVNDFTMTFGDLTLMFQDTMNCLTIPGVCDGLDATPGAGALDIDIAAGSLLSGGIYEEVSSATVAIPDTNGTHYVYWNPSTEALESTTVIGDLYNLSDWKFNPICQTVVSGSPGGSASAPQDIRHFVVESGGSRHIWTVDDNGVATFKTIEAALQTWANWASVSFPMPEKISLSQTQSVTATILIDDTHPGIVIEGTNKDRHASGNPNLTWTFDGPLFEIDNSAGLGSATFRNLRCRFNGASNASNEIFWLFSDTGSATLGLTVENCYIDMNNGGAAPNGFIWIQNSGDLSGFIISDNSFIGGDARDAGIHIGSNVPASSLPSRISGNLIDMDNTGRLNGSIGFEETGGIVLWGDETASSKTIRNVEVSNNVVVSAPNHGVIVRDAEDVVVRDNKIEDIDGDYRRGVFLSAVSAGTLFNCWVKDNSIDMEAVATAVANGIRASALCSDVHIVGNSINMPDVEDVVSIDARIASGLTIERNRLHYAGVTSTAIDGIVFSTSSAPPGIVDSNLLVGIKRYGIRIGLGVTIADGQTVVGNHLNTSLGTAILIDTGTDKFHTIKGNSIRVTGAGAGAGIDCNGCSYARIEGNVINGSGHSTAGFDGITLSDDGHHLIRDNTIDNTQGTTGACIRVNSGADVHTQIQGNHLNGGQYGIEFASSPDHCMVSGNMITGVDTAVDINSQALDCLFSGNMIDSPTISAFLMGTGSDRNTLLANHIRNSAAVAIFFDDGGDTCIENIIVGNHVHVDDGVAIEIEDALTNIVVGNFIDAGDGAANEDGLLIDLSGSGGNTIVGNLAAGNGTGAGINTNNGGTPDIVVGNVSNPAVNTKGGDSTNNNI